MFPRLGLNLLQWRLTLTTYFFPPHLSQCRDSRHAPTVPALLVQGMELRALCILGEHSTTGLHPKPRLFIYVYILFVLLIQHLYVFMRYNMIF